MSRIVAYTSPARGHLFPLMPILKVLRSRGHDVTLFTLRSEVEWIRRHGVDARALAQPIEDIRLEDWKGSNPRDGLRRSVETFAARAPLESADLAQAIDALRPDAVLTDINAWGSNVTAEASGLPWTVFCPYPLPLRSADVPPFGPGLPPARGPVGRLRDRALRPVVFGMLEKIQLPPLNVLRRDHGLAPITDGRTVYDGADALLYLTAEPFEYPRSDWPSNVRMIGPASWDPPADPPAWLDNVDLPIVLVTTSSEYQDDGKLVRTALEGLADEPVQVVATVPARNAADFPTPRNARVETFVPHGLVLDRAVCAVTHGGMGATQKALTHGVPVCAVPFGRDQFEVARRVEVCGGGVRLLPNRMNPARLRAAVRDAIKLTPGAQRIGAAFRAAGGATRAADHVETSLRSRTLD